MKPLRTVLLLATILSVLIGGLLAPVQIQPAIAQGEATPLVTPETPSPEPPTQTPTLEPPAQETDTPEPTETNTLQPTQDDFRRPLVVVRGYSASTSNILPGSVFDLEVRLANEGQETAKNIVATFASGDFFPTQTGGVVAVTDLPAGDKHKIVQPLKANNDLWGKTVASQTVTITYTNPDGISYQETFTITFPIAWERIVGQATATLTPTASPTPSLRPQLVIPNYTIDPVTLEPGGAFSLEVNVQNLGQTGAKQVTMILGGGAPASGESPDGTQPAPGGISGGSADLTNFAPLGSSNVQSLGDLPAGSSLTVRQELIVNVSTQPGAYPLKITFTYIDDKNIRYTDDQVITLLVYAPPKIEISFYRTPDPLFTGQPGMLPIQIVNLGRKSILLGNMEVTGEGADFTNNVILVGNLEAGNYYTLDATAIPFQAGPLALQVSVNFTDDFNQAQEIVQTLNVEVMETPPMEPGSEGIPGEGGFPGEGMPPAGPETLWQKIGRFIRGLLGLDSGQTQPPLEGPPPGVEEVPAGGVPLKGP
ncbi:MAG TPA: hypothetical protein VI776_09215 [Anaerolineales bacterium]|nr:hypothetical protein [Anaerolineales bacterium]